ncbi:MAG: ABC transporter substrate-binding protein [Pyrinomonadaceae bacterium]
MKAIKYSRYKFAVRRPLFFTALVSGLLLGGCTELERPRVEPFYAVSVPPPTQELRWSNGALPKSFDPARAAAAPETDVVQAVYEGLTSLDSRTLSEAPAAAERWESSSDLRTWTFHLRRDLRWSNGERVTARDFVRSWKRLASLGDKVPNRYLYRNIAGLGNAKDSSAEPRDLPSDMPAERPDPVRLDGTPSQPVEPGEAAVGLTTTPPVFQDTDPPPPLKHVSPSIGVQTIDDATLRVTLVKPDRDFARLVSNSLFRPVYGSGANFDSEPLDIKIVTNGPFRVAAIAEDGLTLERSSNYWNAAAVKLDRVQLIAGKSSEAALDAYRRGEVDLVTNTSFEPLALKLLAPYEDFRKATHNALNFYEFNITRPPFTDRRVREALAIAIDRGKLADSELEGAMRPAYALFPDAEASQKLTFDVERARDLLANAGYPLGGGFPRLRLIINRNNAQQRVARSVAKMWKQGLGIETDIIVKEPGEVDAARRSGDFEILRRGIVLPTNDELINLTAILGDRFLARTDADEASRVTGPSDVDIAETAAEQAEQISIPTHRDAMYDLHVIPLYFPISYSLVKPYVLEYEISSLDAVSLIGMSIDSTWRPKPQNP